MSLKIWPSKKQPCVPEKTPAWKRACWSPEPSLGPFLFMSPVSGTHNRLGTTDERRLGEGEETLAIYPVQDGIPQFHTQQLFSGEAYPFSFLFKFIDF